MSKRQHQDGEFVVGHVTVKATTGSALLVDVDGEDIWFPWSQIHENSELYEGAAERGDEGELVVTEWVAKQKGLL